MIALCFLLPFATVSCDNGTLATWPESQRAAVPAMSIIEQRYYAFWLVGLAAVGVVLLVASNKGALSAVELLIGWAMAFGFLLLPI